MTSEPLNVGIVVDSLATPKWIARCIDAIRHSGAAKISLVIVNTTPARTRSADATLVRLYEQLDKRRRKVADDPIDTIDSTADLAGTPQVRAAVGGGALLGDIENQARARLDVLLNLSRSPIEPPDRKAIPLGLWSFDFTEFTPNGTAQIAKLVADTREERRILYSSPTGALASPSRMRPNVYYKAAAFPARVLRDLVSGGGQRPAERATGRAGPVSPLRQLAKAGFAAIANRVLHSRSRNQWILGARFRAAADPPGPSLSFGNFVLIEPPQDRFWADPFPLEHDGRHYVFFEDYPYSVRRGHLSVLEIDAGGKASSPTEVMKTDFHLSFPNVFRHDGELYMLPETHESRQVRLYRCERFPDKWGLAAVLIDNIAALDPVLLERDGRWWMFVGTREPGAEGSDELSLFHAPGLFGPWTPHARNPVVSDAFSARPAGNVYRISDSLLRPSQDCSRRYGYGLVINRIDLIADTGYEEAEIARIFPEKLGFLGVHTINHNDRFTVADFLRRTPA